MNVWLGSGFHGSQERWKDRPALSMSEGQLSYAALAQRAGGIARALASGPDQPGASRLTALLAARSVAAYAGILGILYTGHGYVPLNPSHPADRLAYVLGHSGAGHIVVDTAGEAVLEEVLRGSGRPMTIVFADRDSVDDVALLFPGHDIRAGRSPAALPAPPAVAPDDVAYLLYTSGSTGKPKGVMVSHANVAHFLRVMHDRYAPDETDRFSQMFDLGFDLSVFDLFMAWSSGGTLCCPDPGEVMLPAEYIRREAITVWFSVPSVAVLLGRLRLLEAGAFPGLRLSLFCGEALPASAALAWASAAPNAVVENLYGPTEVTLACTLYRIGGDESAWGSVPIGTAFDGMTARVVDETLAEVPPGDAGELLMCGPQVALGYWQDEARTAAAFVTDPATGARAYRTGDLVRRPLRPGEPIEYLGRLDHQIKLMGHRIELGEVEAALRDATGTDHVVAMGWPQGGAAYTHIVAFAETPTLDPGEVNARLAERLPAYMIPKKIIALERFPLTPNGKIDRKALAGDLTAPARNKEDAR